MTSTARSCAVTPPGTCCGEPATSETGPITAGTRYSALNRLTTATHLLDWLAQRDHDLASWGQADLESYLVEHPNRRNDLYGFLAWARRTRRGRTVSITPAPKPLPRTVPADDEHRWTVARALLHDDGYAPGDRVAGVLVLLFAQNPGRIRRLCVDDVTVDATPVSIRLGTSPIHLPEPFGQHVRDLVATRHPMVGKRLADPGPWLYPSKHPDRAALSATITNRLQRVGIQPTAHRAAALLHLAGQMPPALLGDLLGLGRTAVQEWSTLAARPWATYVADRLEAESQPHS